MLIDMSFTREKAIKALKMTNNNFEQALDWILAHPGEPSTAFETNKGQ